MNSLDIQSHKCNFFIYTSIMTKECPLFAAKIITTMKKIYTILAAAMFSVAAADAQRLVDFQTTMSAPASGAVITSGQSLTVSSVVTNISAVDSLKMIDTTYYHYTIDGSIITFNQTFNTYVRTGRSLKPNDTMHVNRSFSLTFPPSLDGTRNFCIVVRPSNMGTDAMMDPVLANNSSRAVVTFVGGTNSVNAISGSASGNFVTNVYPTPASNTANIDINLSGNASVSVKVTDLVGRSMSIVNKGSMKKGAHTLNINTESLPTGIYIYQVIMNEEVSSGKLIIAK